MFDNYEFEDIKEDNEEDEEKSGGNKYNISNIDSKTGRKLLSFGNTYKSKNKSNLDSESEKQTEIKTQKRSKK